VTARIHSLKAVVLRLLRL